jgi:CYTH domain-containing protein
MGKEIERKFLVKDESWGEGTTGVPYRQGYLAVGPPVAVRVRIAGDTGYLNIKRATLDITRDEFKYPIPLEDAEAMLSGLCEGFLIEKSRHEVTFAGMLWEIDVFRGANEGLVIAEIELSDPDQHFERPPWLGKEVSGDPRYLNTSLSRNPYSRWRQPVSDDADLGPNAREQTSYDGH